MTLSARFFRWHRWLGWLVALQVLAWIAGGLAFTWLPFKPWVKGEEAVAKPQLEMPAQWAEHLARYVAASSAAGAQPPLAAVLAVHSVATASGAALRLRHATSETWLAASGGVLAAPDAQAIAAYARQLYRGEGALGEVIRLEQVPPRLLIVREAGARKNLWRTSFDDAIGTRLYFDGRSGELVAVRNDAWVLYDFFWRLHLMDYSEGEDFNHWLVRAASLLAFGFLLTGLVLSALALRRAWRQWRGRRRRQQTHA